MRWSIRVSTPACEFASLLTFETLLRTDWQMTRSKTIRNLALAALISTAAWAQPEVPDSMRTRAQVSTLLDHYPPALKSVLELDLALLGNQSYLSAYPALGTFLNSHPEIARNPSFYLGDAANRRFNSPERESPMIEIWRNVFQGLTMLLVFGTVVGVVVWLIRTIMDYRRWQRLAKVQADVHTKILDRFTANDELLAYIQSHAGRRFLESSPIMLDEGPRSVAAPLGRILWSVQFGLILTAGGIGLHFVSGILPDDGSQPLRILSGMAIAIGIGFVLSAGVSYILSRRLGLIDPASRPQSPVE